MQLPPTLTGHENSSKLLQNNDLSKTMFTRMMNTGISPILLKRQYRCHPVLGSLASDLFYDSKLVNGVSEEKRSPLVKGWPPLLFFDISGAGARETVQDSGSFVNVQEARFITWLANALVSNGVSCKQIGIICLYKAQAFHVQTLLHQSDSSSAHSIQVSTVDAFQGGEREIVLVSSCRTQSLGFIASPNRMNVAITRSRRHLVIVGCKRTLPQNEHWRLILERASSLPGGYRDSCEYQMSNDIEILDGVESGILLLEL